MADASADASNSLTVNGDRSVALGQGSIYIPACAAGGNAGGGDNGAVGFLGFAYIPAWCQDFQYAAFLISVGDYDGACAVMAASKVGKRAAKNGVVPKCVKPEPVPEPVPTVVVIDGESCAAKEKTERILEKCGVK
jgi:hypothetical protein